MPNELVKINFYGDHLVATQDEDGRVWVSLRRCCEALGLDLSSQMAKLKGKSWASVAEITMDATDDSKRVLTCIDLGTLPGWLFSIDARKVAEGVREKLAQFQNEAARVLADHFLRRKAAAPAEDVGQLRQAVGELRGLVAAMAVRLEQAALPAPKPSKPKRRPWEPVVDKILTEAGDGIPFDEIVERLREEMGYAPRTEYLSVYLRDGVRAGRINRYGTGFRGSRWVYSSAD